MSVHLDSASRPVFPISSKTDLRDSPAPGENAVAEFLSRLKRPYDVVEKEIMVGDARFSILLVRDTNRLIDAIDPKLFAIDERFPYWAELWPSALGLAQFCLEDDKIRGARVLELGCGLGLAGIAAARAGATVMMTDYEEDALQFARYNALQNLTVGQCGRVEFVLMDWRAPIVPGKFDRIIAADVIYERRNFSPLLDLIQASLVAGGVAHFTDPHRSVGQSFRDAAIARGLALTEQRIPVTMDAKSHDIVRYEIHRHHAKVRNADGR